MKTKNNEFQRILLLIILPFIMMIILQSCKKPAELEKTNLTVQAVLGDVIVTADGADKTPQAGIMICENSVIKTGSSSLIDMKYGDYGVIRINENSILVVSELKQDSRVELNKGKIFAVLSKLKKNTQFQIKTTTAVAAIRGTTFRITADDKKSRIDVLAGTVKVNPVKEGKVIEDIEKYVEKNTAVEMNEKTVEAIVDKKQEIQVSVIQPETIQEIKVEAKNITLDEKTSETIKEEIKEVGIEIGNMINPETKTLKDNIKAAKIEKLIKKKTKTIEEIKEIFDRIDEISLYSGRVIRGAIISRGKTYSILTPEAEGIITIPKDDVRSVNVIR